MLHGYDFLWHLALIFFTRKIVSIKWKRAYPYVRIFDVGDYISDKLQLGTCG